MPCLLSSTGKGMRNVMVVTLLVICQVRVLHQASGRGADGESLGLDDKSRACFTTILSLILPSPQTGEVAQSWVTFPQVPLWGKNQTLPSPLPLRDLD